MSGRRVISVGRRDYPRDLWGPGDFEAERRKWERLEGPLPHAPAGIPGELKFSLFPERTEGGVRSKAVDELIARYVGGRR